MCGESSAGSPPRGETTWLGRREGDELRLRERASGGESSCSRSRWPRPRMRDAAARSVGEVVSPALPEAADDGLKRPLDERSRCRAEEGEAAEDARPPDAPSGKPRRGESEAMPKMSAAVDGMACTWDAGAEDAGGGRSPGPSGGEPKMGTYMMPIVKKDRSHASACGPRSPRVRGGGP